MQIRYHKGGSPKMQKCLAGKPILSFVNRKERYKTEQIKYLVFYFLKLNTQTASLSAIYSPKLHTFF